MFGEAIVMRTVSVIVLIVIQSFIFANGECPSRVLIEPCVCIPAIPSDIFEFNFQLRPQITVVHRKSIVCENIHDSSFDLRSIFVRFSTALSRNNESSRTHDDDNSTHFDAFLLYNTAVRHLPENVFGNITFSGLIFQNNPLLSSINVHAFTGTREHVEVFQTLNTSLSNANGIFTVLRQLSKLRMVSMHNDRLRSIPDYAFNHTRLTDIWLGLEEGQTSQPIVQIGQYPFYHVPKLTVLRIFSPFLNKIGKYALAQRDRSIIGVDDLHRMLTVKIGSPMLNDDSFEATSFTRFRSRAVFLRFYNTSITYLNEIIFQPFLETHPSSLLDVKNSNISQTCDCRSVWIYRHYCTDTNWLENRVYGTACCAPQFNLNCTLLT